MALKRLTVCAIICCVLLGLSAWAQIPSGTFQDGVMVFDGYGPVYGIGEPGSAAINFPGVDFDLGNILGRDLELVSDADGNVIGGYMLDAYGGQDYLGDVTPPSELAESIPFFGWEIARDLEVAPNWIDATNDYKGYLILDGQGGIHAVGDVNLPQYPLGADGAMIDTPFPEALIIAGSADQSAEVSALAGLQAGSADDPSQIRPLFPYWGWDIARDLEISAQYVTISTELIVDSVDPAIATASAASQGRRVGLCNGYYILDGYGAVHSCRLPLQFDVDDNGVVDETDMESPDFGKPANGLSLVIPWVGSYIPYFGWDIARDIELTPSGNGYYLLDGFGTVHTVGDAQTSFPNPRTPYFGFEIASALAVVPNMQGDAAAGYLVLNSYGLVFKAGFAEDYNISSEGNDGERIDGYAESFVDVETTPVFYGATEPSNVPGYAVTVAPVGADISDPFIVWNPDLEHIVVPFADVTDAPYPFFDLVTQ